MTDSIIQKELDRAEEYILMKLFGDSNNLEISNNLKMAFTFKGINFENFINQKILEFEKIVYNFMRQDGYLDVKKIEDMVSIKFPILSGLKLPSARLIDLIRELEKIIPLEKIGEIIRRI